MILLNSDVHCKNGQKGIYSLAVIIVYTSIYVFISSIYNYNINQNHGEKTQSSRFQFKKSGFCLSDVLGTFLYNKSRTQVKFLKVNLF